MIRANEVLVRLGADHSRIALQGVSATFERRSVVAIVGRNAAGKTTLLRALAGLVDLAEGTVEWDGRAPERWSAAERAGRVAYVAQRSALSARFSVAETIELGRYALVRSRARVSAAIRMFGLDEIESRVYHELSVGQQQRVALARAWAQVDATGALLLDEPFAAMDLAETDRSVRLLRTHARGGGLAVVVLHDLSLAARIADMVVLLDAGRVAVAGPVRQVLTPDVLSRQFGVPFRLDIDGIPEPIVGQADIV